jgi:hypothetical protein
MEVETGGICREYGGKMTYSLHRTVAKLARTRSRDKIQLYMTERECGYARLPNSKPVESY